MNTSEVTFVFHGYLYHEQTAFVKFKLTKVPGACCLHLRVHGIMIFRNCSIEYHGIGIISSSNRNFRRPARSIAVPDKKE